MITDLQQARRIAQDWIAQLPIDPDDKVALEGDPRETEFGWVFFYNSAHYLETGDVGYALMGNAPIVVMKSTGDVRGTGTAEPLDVYLDQIRASLIKN